MKYGTLNCLHIIDNASVNMTPHGQTLGILIQTKCIRILTMVVRILHIPLATHLLLLQNSMSEFPRVNKVMTMTMTKYFIQFL